MFGFLKKAKIKHKLFASSSVNILLLLALLGLGYVSNQDLSRQIHDIFGRTFRNYTTTVNLIDPIKDYTIGIYDAISMASAGYPEDQIAERIKPLPDKYQAIMADLDAMGALYSEGSAGADLYAQVKDEFTQYGKTTLEVLDAVTYDIDIAYSSMEPSKATYAKLDQLLNKLKGIEADRLKREEHSSYDKIARITHANLLFFLVITAVSVLFAMYIKRSVADQLSTLMEFSGDLAGGDFTCRMWSDRGDEVGQLCNLLSGLAEKQQTAMSDLEEKAEEADRVAQSAKHASDEAEKAKARAERDKERMIAVAHKLEKVIENVGEASAQIEAMSRDIQSGTDVQMERAQSTATAMEEMTATVLEVARNAAESAEQAELAMGKAREGAHVVESSIDSMNTIQEQAGGLKEDMNRLGEQAVAIGNILNVISDIADQTNLLALNAAIEAARAGDAGRGFAVVADEVRKLAEKTMQATKEVGDSIGAIQSVAKSNVSSMDSVVGLIDQARELVDESGDVLREIVDNVETSAGQVRNIATAAEQQSATSEEINTSLDEINRIAHQTADAVSESVHSITSLAGQSEELQRVIAEMRL